MIWQGEKEKNEHDQNAEEFRNKINKCVRSINVET